MKIEIDEKFIHDGWYGKPHYLVRLAKDKKLTKSEYIFLDLLIHYENRYTKQPNQWFHIDNEEICSTHLLSSKLIKSTRDNLMNKGLINFKKGYSHHETDYRILLDGYYYRGSIFGVKGN